eukprot:GHVU01033677.1.p2 GENE.GHVU01033677.1~~GHVU01033677.1.p2  ORF type:complete len:127 (+),score=7.30 GHVU01033677.1:188-568(+)
MAASMSHHGMTEVSRHPRHHHAYLPLALSFHASLGVAPLVRDLSQLVRAGAAAERAQFPQSVSYEPPTRGERHGASAVPGHVTLGDRMNGRARGEEGCLTHDGMNDGETGVYLVALPSGRYYRSWN